MQSKRIDIIEIPAGAGINFDTTRVFCLYAGRKNRYFGIIVSSWGITLLFLSHEIIICW